MRRRDLAVILGAALVQSSCFGGFGGGIFGYGVGFGRGFGVGRPLPPAAPAGLTVAPVRSSVDDFTFSWQPSSGAASYDYSVGGRTLGSTSTTSVRLVDRSVSQGTNSFCVTARSGRGLASPPACVSYGWQRIPTAIGPISWPSGLLSSTVSVSARLQEYRSTGLAPLGGHVLRFDYQFGGATATTDATGVAQVRMVLQGRAGTYSGVVTFASDRDHDVTQASTPFRIYVDTTPPSVPVVSVAPARSQVNDFTASWPASTDDLTGVDRYVYRVDGGAPSFTTGTSVRGPLAPSLGTHRLEVAAIDKAGNQSAYGPASFELFIAPTPTPPPPPSPRPQGQQGPQTSPQRISVDIPAR